MLQFIKFSSIGVLNTAVDLGVLNLLIVLFGTGAHGEYYAAFKALSFLVAVINSYFFNKYWVFRQSEGGHAKEPLLFFGVSVVGLFLNVGVSFFVFSIVTAMYELSPSLVVNIGAIAGTGVVFLWNFIGYKFIVFTSHTK